MLAGVELSVAEDDDAALLVCDAEVVAASDVLVAALVLVAVDSPARVVVSAALLVGGRVAALDRVAAVVPRLDAPALLVSAAAVSSELLVRVAARLGSGT